MANEMCGSVGAGSVMCRSPNRSPIVSTGSWASQTTAVVATRATNGAGTRRLTRGHRMRIAIVAAATAIAAQFTESSCRANAGHLSKKFAGTAPIRSPNRSFTWLVKMISAIPLVNPVTTGCGTNLIALPSLVTPSTIRINPAISVAACKPASPCVWTTP